MWLIFGISNVCGVSDQVLVHMIFPRCLLLVRVVEGELRRGGRTVPKLVVLITIAGFAECSGGRGECCCGRIMTETTATESETGKTNNTGSPCSRVATQLAWTPHNARVSRHRYSGFGKSNLQPASQAERWFPCAGKPRASLSSLAVWRRFQVMNVVFRFVKSFSGPPEPSSR